MARQDAEALRLASTAVDRPGMRPWLSPEALARAAVLVLTGLGVAVPFAYLVYGAFRTAPPGAPGGTFTLVNWATVYLGAEYWSALLNSVLLAATVAVLSVVVGALLAWLVGRTDLPGAGSLSLLLVVPMLISPLITSLAWIALAAPQAGFLNAAARAVLHTTGPVFDIYSFFGIVFVMVLHYVPYAYLAIWAALRNIDGSLEEASQMLGAGPVSTALRMTLPLVWPAIAASSLVVFVFAAENFAVPTMLGAQVGFQTIPSRLYSLLNFAPASPMLAATAGTMLLCVALPGTLVQRYLAGGGRRYVTVGGKGGRNRIVRLSAWRLPALVFCLLYLALAVVLPYLALVAGSLMRFVTATITPTLFTTANYEKVLGPQNLPLLQNTLVLSTGGGLVVTLLAVFVAWLALRSPRWLASLIDALAIIPNATPAMVVAIGLLWAFIAFPGGLYGTLLSLGIAYLIRYLGYGMRTASAALLQISPELEEAARLQGAGGLRTFRDVVLPLIRPTAISLWTLLFILIFLEISTTILLYSSQTATLSVLLWNQLASGSAPTAFSIGVIQSTIIFALLILAHRLFGTMNQVLGR